jgi:hypothetical protein
LTTTVAAGYDIKELVWVGAGLNLVATLIIVFEKTNDNISKKLLKDIYAIKNGTYVDEGMVIEVDPDTKHQEESYSPPTDEHNGLNDTAQPKHEV